MNTQPFKDTQPRHRRGNYQIELPQGVETRATPPPLYRPASEFHDHQEVHQSNEQHIHRRAHHPQPQPLLQLGAREAVKPHRAYEHQRESRHNHRDNIVHDHGRALYYCQLMLSDDLIDDMIFMTYRVEHCLHKHRDRTQHSSVDCAKRTLDKLAQRYYDRDAANNQHSMPWEDWMADIDFMSSRMLYCMRQHHHETLEAGQECGLAIEDSLARRRNTRQNAKQSMYGAARVAEGAISEPGSLYRQALFQRRKNRNEELQATEINARTASRATQCAAVDALEQIYHHKVNKLRREAQHRAEEFRRQSFIRLPPPVESYLDEDFERLCKEAILMQTLVRSIDTVYSARSNHAPLSQHEQAKQTSRPLAFAGDTPPTRHRFVEHIPDAYDARLSVQLIGPRMADRTAPQVIQPWTRLPTHRPQTPTSPAAPQEMDATEGGTSPGLSELFSTAIPIRADTPSPRPQMPPVSRQLTKHGHRYIIPLTSSPEQESTLPAHSFADAEFSEQPEDEHVWSRLSSHSLTPTSSTMGDWGYLDESEGEGFSRVRE